MVEKIKRGQPEKGVTRTVVSLDNDIRNAILAGHDRKYGYVSRKVNELLFYALQRTPPQPLEKPVKSGKLRK